MQQRSHYSSHKFTNRGASENNRKPATLIHTNLNQIIRQLVNHWYSILCLHLHKTNHTT